MVEPHHVHELQGLAHSVDPPPEPLGAKTVPVVERIAPELPGDAERIRWHPAHDGRPPIRVELPQVRTRPHVGGVVGDEDRNVANDPDPPLIGVALEIEPLP